MSSPLDKIEFCGPITVKQRWPGLIPRQDLVLYCVTRVEMLKAELLREQNILADKEKTMTDEQYETLMLSSTSLMGHIMAFREITEWARENKLEVSVL